MASNCGVCGDLIADTTSLIKCTGPCNLSYHVTCTRLKTEKALRSLGSKKEKWSCDTCKDNASNKSSVPCTPITQDYLARMLDAFRDEIRMFKDDVFQELKKYNTEVSDLRKSTEYLSNTVDTANKLMEELKDEIKKLKKENESLQIAREEDGRSIRELRVKVRQLEQYSRRENIEISGVPVSARENVMAVVGDVGKALGVTMDPGTVVAAHRVPTYSRNRTPPIVVRFQTRDLRDTWIEGYKKNKSVTAKDVNSSFPPTKFYVSEHLSPDLKLMLAKTKEFCKNKGYRFVWVKEGKLFIRKGEGDNCIRIDDLSELNKIK